MNYIRDSVATVVREDGRGGAHGDDYNVAVGFSGTVIGNDHGANTA